MELDQHYMPHRIARASNSELDIRQYHTRPKGNLKIPAILRTSYAQG